MSEGPAACANCGAGLSGRFCAVCGQDGRTRINLAVLAAQALAGLTNLDSRLWRTLRDFLVPGRITVEYLAGHRVRYLPPVQTYLVVAVLFFAVLPAGVDGMVANLFHERVSANAAASGMTVEQQLAEARDKGHLLSSRSVAFRDGMSRFSLLMLVAVPLFGLMLHGAHHSRRRDYVESLVLAIHLQTVLFALLTAFFLVVIIIVTFWLPVTVLKSAPVWLLVGALYGVLSVRRMYGEALWVATVKYLAVGIAHMSVLIAIVAAINRSA